VDYHLSCSWTQRNISEGPLSKRHSASLLIGCLGYSRSPSFILERGVYKPSAEESLAPFHRDPTQRIIAFHPQRNQHYFVLRVGAFLELSRGREGTEIEWDEWKNHVAIPSRTVRTRRLRAVQVSGCRIIFIGSAATGSGFETEVFDFSVEGRAKYSSSGLVSGLGRIDHLSSTGGRVQIPLEGFLERP
jgi:hypothetical protein